MAAPTLLNPPIPDKLHVEPVYRIDSDRSDAAIHLSNGGEPVLVSFGERQGMVWIAGMFYPFTNEGLHDPSNARLILNLLSGVPKERRLALTRRITAHRKACKVFSAGSSAPRRAGVLS